jgi:phosphoglycerol transferase MdoB-like AlkP superfamily enzyme
MDSIQEPQVARMSWWKSRYGFACFSGLSLVAAWLVLRLVFLTSFRPPGIPFREMALALAAGFQRDLFVVFLFLLPLLFWFWLVPNRRFGAPWHRALVLSGGFVFSFSQFFLLFVEYYFFEEFRSRFNTVAVDYLIYPQEVVTNIWQSYHLVWVILICLFLAAGWILFVSRMFRAMWQVPVSAVTRGAAFAGVLVAAALLAPSFNLKQAQVSSDRTINAIANNGTISFFAAAWTRHLDYEAFYRTVPRDEAYARARRVLAEPGTSFVESGESIQRRVEGDASRPRLNVVICLEESLGSEFWGCLGRTNTLTPEMDQLAATEGMLFTNIYACGNRTVRGMEGVLSSFPPLPGDSIVKRDRSDNVETIARVLKRDGYATVFLYGGRGVFDGMRSYAVRNGYDRFIEQKHFARPTFATAWGVCDEDLFSRSIQEFRDLAKAGKPFLGTILTVSNHRPYTYPKGRIPEDPAKKWRRNAVKYSDYSLGEFFRQARKEAFWTNTVFVVVADHGARAYGKQTIPIRSYEIPLLIAGPAVVKQPSRIAQLGSSLDVAPTILGLVGRPYQTLFFGRDLLKTGPQEGRAFLNHNRDIGVLAGDRMVVLGLQKTAEFYAGNPKKGEMVIQKEPSHSDLELEKDAAAVYQVANDLYVNFRYRLDGINPSPAPASGQPVHMSRHPGQPEVNSNP